MKRTLILVIILLGLGLLLAARDFDNAALTEHEYVESSFNTDPGDLVINEIQAQNNSFQDPFGEYDDWVEIYNPNAYAIDLGGMYLSDSHYSGGIDYWTQIPATAPSVTTIPAHGFVIVWFDNDLDQGPLHVMYNLGGSADAVYLIAEDGATLVDSYIWTDLSGLNSSGVSLGRNPDGGPNWQLYGAGLPYPCTPGSSNQGNANAAPVLANISYSPNPSQANSPLTITAQVSDNNLAGVQLLWGLEDYTLHAAVMTLQGGVYRASIGDFAFEDVIQYRIKATDDLNMTTLSPVYNITIGYQSPALVINEIMASNTVTAVDNYGGYEDWVEIYNPNSTAVNLAGYYLVDSHYGDYSYNVHPIPFTQPDSTTIAAGGYKVLWFDDDRAQGVLHINSRLGASGDAVYLLSPDGTTVLDSHDWNDTSGLAVNDVSAGRFPNGWDSWQLYGANQVYASTPGAPNPGAANTAPVISLISYTPVPILPNQPVTVSAHVRDAENNLSAVSLNWGLSSTTENTTAMTLQDGVYTGSLTAVGMGGVIQFSIRAVDIINAQTNTSTYTLSIGYQAPQIYINEIMASNSTTVTDNYNEFEDWVELYNAGNTPVDLAGYGLVDHHFGDYTFNLMPISPLQPDSTSIPAHGFKVFWFDEQTEQGVLHINTKLNVLEDALYLVAPDQLQVLDHVSWNASTGLVTDLSYGRYPDGTTTWNFFGGVSQYAPTPGASNGSVGNADEHVTQIIPSLSCYPNPVHTSLTVELKNLKKATEVRIYNLKGSLVGKFTCKPGSKAVWNCVDLQGKPAASGLYILRAEVGSKCLTGKICLIH